MVNFDFSGWATRNNVKCSDGRTILKDAFKHNDGSKVPLVWNHQHASPDNVIGHARLENRDEGVYAYGVFNNTPMGQYSKELVQHEDVVALSIYANQLKQQGSNVLHGAIREVSLVLAGANPGAFIDSIIKHGEESEEEAIIFTGEEISIAHADDDKENAESKSEGKTIKEIIDGMTDEQKEACYALVGLVLDDNGYDDDAEADDDKEDVKHSEGGDDKMKHNVFEKEVEETNVLSHDAMQTIISDGKRYGSLKESFLAHAEEYGIQNLEYLFPEAKNQNMPPQFIKRDTSWVSVVMNGTHHTPFSRIKTMYADITEDEARAKGYIKGKLKKEEVFSLLKRSTSPTTIYKKQKMDRDDVVDITDFDVIAWLKSEMRMMLDEEIARAILIGDGRLSSSDDKIDENCIRPVINDADLYVIRWSVAPGADADEKSKNFIRASIKSRKNYKGSGTPTLFTTEDMLTDMLLLEDGIGHKLYKTEGELATALRVKNIVTVPLMEGLVDKDGKEVYGIIVNMSDYTVGADKGGAINMFDDFDIDYNQQKYLIETRCSGSLNKPFSAIVLRAGTSTASEEPTLAEAMAPFKK